MVLGRCAADSTSGVEDAAILRSVRRGTLVPVLCEDIGHAGDCAQARWTDSTATGLTSSTATNTGRQDSSTTASNRFSNPVVGSADVADVSLAELVCAQAGKKCGEDKCEIAFGPVGLAIRSLAPRDGFPEALVATSECGARP
jgi:hypothetical protein